MTRASRFLWLDWSKAKISTNNPNILNGIHDGYIKLELSTSENWKTNRMRGGLSPINSFRSMEKKSPDNSLNWLLPDWQFIVEGNAIKFIAPFGNKRFELFTQNGIV